MCKHRSTEHVTAHFTYECDGVLRTMRHASTNKKGPIATSEAVETVIAVRN